jgi:hypothetical protein
MPSPPLLLAFFRANSASSKISRFLLGETGACSEVYVGGRNCGSIVVNGSAVLNAGEAGNAAVVESLHSRSDDRGKACTLSSGRSSGSGET